MIGRHLRYHIFRFDSRGSSLIASFRLGEDAELVYGSLPLPMTDGARSARYSYKLIGVRP